jgi:steroid delta-isomerase-like uncharacterized protein
VSEQNKTLMRRAVKEVWNGENIAAVDELVTSDVVLHLAKPGDEIRGAESVTQFYTTLQAAFPDIHFTIDDQIADGDKVVTRWTCRGTHKGEFQGMSPTGKQINVTGIDIDRIANGKVVECWPIMDELGMLQQLGVVPAPGQGGGKP